MLEVYQGFYIINTSFFVLTYCSESEVVPERTRHRYTICRKSRYTRDQATTIIERVQHCLLITRRVKLKARQETRPAKYTGYDSSDGARHSKGCYSLK